MDIHLPLLAQASPSAQTRTSQPAKPVGSEGPHWENLIYIAAGIVGLVVLILILRWAVRISKWLFLAVLFIVGGIWTVHTLYNRTEPAWLTPVFDVLAEWLPTKDYVAPDPAKAAEGAPRRK
jgi:hypothetical protein